MGSTELEYCHPGGKCWWAAPRRDPPQGEARLAALAALPGQGSGGRGSTTVHMGAACPRTCAPGGRLSKEPSCPPLAHPWGAPTVGQALGWTRCCTTDRLVRLTPSALGHWCRSSSVRGRPGHCGVLSSPYPVDAENPPQCDNHRSPLTSPGVPWGQNHPPSPDKQKCHQHCWPSLGGATLPPVGNHHSSESTHHTHQYLNYEIRCSLRSSPVA